MNISIVILILIFSCFFIIDIKPLNILWDFIALIILISIYIIINFNQLNFIAYILLIIYASAIAILFGFVIMLYKPNIPKDNNFNEIIYPNNFLLYKQKYNILFLILIISLIPYIFININKIQYTIIEFNINIIKEELVNVINILLYNMSSNIIYIILIIYLLLIALMGIIIIII